MPFESGPSPLPIPPTGAVLEVGSGSRPHPRATVLVDRYLSNNHREGRRLERAGRPLVLADAAALPFRSGAFVFSIAVHVLEHVDDAPAMLRELQRVSNSGYIETPTPLHDFLFSVVPYPEIHLWWVGHLGSQNGGGELVLHRKTPDIACQPFADRLDWLRRNDPHLEAWMERRPRLFTTQYHWTGRIAWRVALSVEELTAIPAEWGATPYGVQSRRGFHWGTGFWGWKRWLYAWVVHPAVRKQFKSLLGSKPWRRTGATRGGPPTAP